MDHAGMLRGFEARCDLGRDFENFFFGESSAFCHDVLEAAAFEEFHDEVKSAIRAADGVNIDDVWVTDLSR